MTCKTTAFVTNVAAPSAMQPARRRTGPVDPAMARPTFGLGPIFFKFKNNCELFKIKSVYNNKATFSGIRKQ